jgi:hypothetical protein
MRDKGQRPGAMAADTRHPHHANRIRLPILWAHRREKNLSASTVREVKDEIDAVIRLPRQVVRDHVHDQRVGQTADTDLT